MKATHSIKVNGRWYMAGEEIPGHDAVEQRYSKSKITFMKAAEAKELALKENLISEDSGLQSAQIKELLIKHFGL